MLHVWKYLSSFHSPFFFILDNVVQIHVGPNFCPTLRRCSDATFFYGKVETYMTESKSWFLPLAQRMMSTCRTSARGSSRKTTSDSSGKHGHIKHGSVAWWETSVLFTQCTVAPQYLPVANRNSKKNLMRCQLLFSFFFFLPALTLWVSQWKNRM